ncbi:daunorubicin resistance protein DrrA family ABC transporter ATP-binding protein [Conexibacter woesei]|uniref:Daunorubicin resistance ABC transporter ATPase subunit n=1 Tax=Conexibacter woesei (strain DSM 14684 / CCUG 47730 / CIP 108061 / JCM 11494 / NBRC 100937 / ID131577) TaxID=469383 RepID=D3F5Q5_CONWI|nr:daunorubicin resistance protein DrrA family ABC transporter ATP-binding protein [Conexibacter woesei]ADB52604.1 daunorubicin resistance ABC transporter ATPase subunit [Conexibacter woesei DSM 14684]
MAYTVEAAGLTKSYGALPVLTGLDLRVASGSVFALLGPNGAGKTTTIRILSTLIGADRGSATVAGHDVATAPRQVRAAISLTGQYAAVDEMLTGEENLLMMARLRHLGRAAGRRRSAELLERFDLADARRRKVSTYSGGMRRRLDLAVSLLSNPPVLFLDEPTTGLDPRSRRAIWEAVGELADAGATVLLTTQYLEEADRLADRVAVIDGGRVVAEGTADELKRRAGSEAVELFFDGDDALAAATAVLRDGHADRERLSLRLATDGSAAVVRRLLDALHDHDVAVQRIELHRPSLDDVFMTLTERSS